MLSKRRESTEVERRAWLHVPLGILWLTSSDTHQVEEIKETCTKMCTTVLIGFNQQYGQHAYFGYWILISDPKQSSLKFWKVMLQKCKKKPKAKGRCN